MTLIRRIRHLNDDGASAVEYGLLIAAIAAVIVAIAFGFGAATKSLFSKTSTCVAAQQSSTC
jgi:pilus assembly protein Flp/PilA